MSEPCAYPNCHIIPWVVDIDGKTDETAKEIIMLQVQLKTLSDNLQAQTAATNHLINILKQVEGGKNLVKGVIYILGAIGTFFAVWPFINR